MAVPLEFDSTWRKGRVRLVTRDSQPTAPVRLAAVTEATVDAVVDIAWRAYSPTPGAVSRPGVSVFRGTAGSHRAADRS
jgi:hypothetical protein